MYMPRNFHYSTLVINESKTYGNRCFRMAAATLWNNLFNNLNILAYS